MQRFMTKLIVTALLVAPVLAPSVLAHEGEDEASTATAAAESKRLTEEQKVKIREEAKKRIQGKLDEAKKRLCEKRVVVIERIMNNAAKMGDKHLGVFDKILTRVQQFYTDKGLSAANYDALVAAAAAKKIAAQAAIDAVEANVSFDCGSDDPVGKTNAFNGKVRAMHQALKDYRVAIKDVIKAVKQAASAAEAVKEEQN